MTSTDTQIELRLEREFAHAPDAVFAAWTDPELLRTWWAAGPDWTTPLAEIDLRIGGRYRLTMHDPESGADHTVGGEFKAIEPPRHVAYTWQWESETGMDTSAISLVEVDFEPSGEGTRVVLTHRGLDSEESRDQHAHGWNACLDNLASRGLV